MKVIIIGKNEQITNSLIENFKFEKNKFNILTKSSQELNFLDSIILKKNLQDISQSIDVIINCVDYADAEKTEQEKLLCDQINHRAVKILADFCRERNILLIHYSTNHVFDGKGDIPFIEDNKENLQPINYYGETKLLAERAIEDSNCNFLIFRISWIYDNRAISDNFVNTIKRLALEKKEIHVAQDKIGSPTSAEFVASNTIRFIKKITLSNFNENQAIFDAKFLNQIYHLNNGQYVSRFEQANQIFRYSKRFGNMIELEQIIPIRSISQQNLTSQKPLNCKLNNQKLNKILNLNHTLQKKYIAVFAHFDKKNIVDDYAIYYLENLKLVADKIIFVSDGDLSEVEQNKLKDLCHTIIAKKHNEYDFGSYKRGLEKAYEYIEDYDAIIIANDSCYGPLKPFNNIFQTMEYSDCDFWGLTINQDGYHFHLQSYFLVFNKNIINSDFFRDFFKKVKQEHCKSDIIKKYEIGLTTHFINCGFKMDSFIKKIFEINPTLDVASYRFIIQNDFPFIKVCAIANNPEIKKIIFEDYLKNDSSMFKYIYNHTKKIKDDKNLTITSQHSNLTNLTTISQYTDVMPIDQTNLLMKKIKKLKKIRKKYLQAIVLLITLLIIILCKIAVRNYNTI